MRKRYYISLDQKIVEDFQSVSKSMKLPVDIMSQICDEAIKQNLIMFRKVQETGALTLSDVLKQASESIREIEDEQRVSKGKEMAKGKKS